MVIPAAEARVVLDVRDQKRLPVLRYPAGDGVAHLDPRAADDLFPQAARRLDEEFLAFAVHQHEGGDPGVHHLGHHLDGEARQVVRNRARRRPGRVRDDVRVAARRRQGHHEARPVARLALRADLAAMPFHDALRDGEPEPHARILAREAVVALVERVEHLLEVGGSDPDAGVLHGDLHVPALAPDAERDRASLGGERDGVRAEVVEHAADQGPVGLQDHLRRLPRRGERDPLRLGQRLQDANHLVHDVDEVERLAAHAEAARLQLRQVEDGVDEVLELQALLVDDAKEVALHPEIRAPHVLLERFHVGADVRQRRAQLVRHR